MDWLRWLTGKAREFHVRSNSWPRCSHAVGRAFEWHFLSHGIFLRASQYRWPYSKLRKSPEPTSCVPPSRYQRKRFRLSLHGNRCGRLWCPSCKGHRLQAVLCLEYHDKWLHWLRCSKTWEICNNWVDSDSSHVQWRLKIKLRYFQHWLIMSSSSNLHE